MQENIGVLFLYFNKTETTAKVLKKILAAKPSTLLLAQDGPRTDTACDEDNVKECRKQVEELVAQIDWACNVYRNYAKENMSCDPREYTAISWAFTIVDKLIIMEDDCLCSNSVLPFMEELLLRYEYDERIAMICGFERFGKNPYCKDSYYFTQASCGGGWATWKRCWDDVERIANDYSFMDDADLTKTVDSYVKKHCMRVYKDYTSRIKDAREENRTHGSIQSWELAQSVSMVMESRLAINPSKNLIKNIGIVPGATHSGSDIRTKPKRIRQFFENEAQELEFPLRHPAYVIRDAQYERLHDKVYKNTRVQKLKDDIVVTILRIRYGQAKEIIDGAKRRINRYENK